MKRAIAFVLTWALALDVAAFAGVGSDKTQYVGGTENQIKEGTEGMSSAKDEKNFVFESKGGNLSIPYGEVNDLEYGQKAGRRIGMAIVISPWLLFSKISSFAPGLKIMGRRLRLSGPVTCPALWMLR